MLDLRTILFGHLITVALCTVVLGFLWQRYRKRYAGLHLWVADFGLQFTGALLIGLRGEIPDWMSMVLANTLVMTGTFLFYVGLEQFVGRPSRQWHNYALLGGFVVVHTFFTVVQPNLTARDLNLSIGLLILSLQGAWLMLRRVPPGLRTITRGVGFILGISGVISLTRIGFLLIRPHVTNDFFAAGQLEALIVVSYQMLLILLCFELVLMVNGRLRAELQAQEEKFAAAFHASPHAVVLSQLTDGQLIEVNEGFLSISGYQRSEVIGQTTPGLRLWDKDEDRAVVVDALRQNQSVRNKEFQFRKKSGERITGLFSAELLTVQDIPLVLSSIHDITARQQAEAALRASEEMFRSLSGNSPTGIFTLDLAGHCVYVNPRHRKIMGTSLMESQGDGWLRHVLPADQERLRAEWAGFARGEHDYSPECRVQIPSHAERLVNLRVAPVLAADGTTTGYVGTSEDITARKQAEEELRRQNAELTKFGRGAVGRELRMIELKQEVNGLCRQLGEEARYRIPADISADSIPPEVSQ